MLYSAVTLKDTLSSIPTSFSKQPHPLQPFSTFPIHDRELDPFVTLKQLKASQCPIVSRTIIVLDRKQDLMPPLLQKLKAKHSPTKPRRDNPGIDSTDDTQYDADGRAIPPHCAGKEGSEEANAYIKARLKAGAPFFTRNRLQALHQEMQRVKGRSKATIHIPDIRGNIVEYSWDLQDRGNSGSRGLTGEFEGWELIP